MCKRIVRFVVLLHTFLLTHKQKLTTMMCFFSWHQARYVRGASENCRCDVGEELSRSLLSFTVVSKYQLFIPSAYFSCTLTYCPSTVTHFPVLLSAALYCCLLHFCCCVLPCTSPCCLLLPTNTPANKLCAYNTLVPPISVLFLYV